MIKIVRADLNKTDHAADLISLMSQYASDPMGGNEDLSSEVKFSLASTLSKRSGVYVILAYDNTEAIGLTTCMQGFSTFKCRPLLNIHDVYIKNKYRGQSITKRLLDEAERIAIETDCCKLTLEVLEGNIAARTAYEKFGFHGYELDPAMGKALFWEKTVNHINS